MNKKGAFGPPSIQTGIKMAICETVAIEDGNGGFLVINKSDFNEKLHKVYGENKPDTKPVAPKKAAK